VRPRRTRWFELLVAHDDVGAAADAFGRSGLVELEARGETGGGRFSMPQVREHLYAGLQADAEAALARAAGRHGLEGLWVYPRAEPGPGTVRIERRSFLGLPLAEAILEGAASAAPRPRPVDPSPEAERCRACFTALLECAARLAALTGNLHRAAAEYRRTERRARALENVLLPEIDAALREIGNHLEALEQEEAIRVRRARAGHDATGVA